MSVMVRLPKHVLLYNQPVDLRMGQIGLTGIVKQDTSNAMAYDTLYLFCNRGRNLVKGIFWDRTGYIVFSKRLESGRFHIAAGKDMAALDGRSLRLFLDGLKIFL